MKLEIIPDINVDNTKIIGLVENLHYFKPLSKRFINKKDVIGFKDQDAIIYEIIINTNNVKFFLGFDDELKENILTELNICWPRAALKKTDFFLCEGETRELELAEHWFLSLNTDLRGQWPLSNLLETQNILRDNEQICIRLEMRPLSPSWSREQEECIKLFESGKNVSKSIIASQNILPQAVNAVLGTVYFCTDLLCEIVTDEKAEHEYIQSDKYARLRRTGLSSDTQQKGRYNAYNTKILVTVNADTERKEMLFRNVYKAFQTMAGDNRFIMVKHSRYKNILCSKEIAQTMQMPTKTYQEQYRIHNIDNREVEIPRDLLTGDIQIGTVTYKGLQATAYWPNNKNILSLPKIVIGPMGSGKSEYTKNFAVQASGKGDSVIVFDFIRNCELSEGIAKHIPNAIRIDLSKHDNLPALAYPEIQPGGDPWERLKVANMLARQTEYLINSLVPEKMTPRMTRYLDAACKVVYIHPGATVQDVINVLTNWKSRNEFIRKAKYSGCFSEDDTEIVDLDSLHEREENGRIIGTRETKIEGILDRLTVLQKDLFLRVMLKVNVDYSQNFCSWMDEGRTILIQMPEHTFTNKQVKDTIVTYFMSRVWLAALQRKTTRIVHVITDEIHQTPTAASLIANTITEARKFGIDFYFTIHYLRQFRDLHDAVRSAGASYMLLAGTEKENLLALEQEIAPFTVAEGLNLKPFHSLNIINYGNQYARFISKLPKPI